jgi:Fasciclin domain
VHFPDLSSFKKLADAARTAAGASGVDNALNSDVTIFAPIDDAFRRAGVSVSAVSPKVAHDMLLYHMLQGSRVVPTGFGNNKKLSTLLKGHTVTSWVNDRCAGGRGEVRRMHASATNSNGTYDTTSPWCYHGVVHVW